MKAIALLFVCGFFVTIQATLNGALSRSLGWALFGVVFSALQLCFGLLTLFWISPEIRAQWQSRSFFDFLYSIPHWQYLGAALGIFLLCGIAAGVSRVGALVGMMSLLLGQLVSGILVDHFGLFGATAQPVSLTRIAGLILVGIGVFFSKQS